MMAALLRCLALVAALAANGIAHAQDADEPTTDPAAGTVLDDAPATDAPEATDFPEATDVPEAADVPAATEVPAAANGGVRGASDAIDEIAADVDRNAEAQQVSAGILKPIYVLAEKMSFPMFHWTAFAIMVAGVVSFALQLVLGKLVVLSKFSLSISEILSDALGLAVSAVGLVLTTQAATQNSTFTTSAFSVLSASGVGALAGFIFYLWGQRQELQAVEGRRLEAARREKLPPGPPRA